MKTVLFVCVHNAGRSQMAEAVFNRIAQEQELSLRAISAGTEVGHEVNPIARQVMEEMGISMETHCPKVLTSEMVDTADRIVTMGCGVEASACPGRVFASEDWGLDDPKDKGVEEVRAIRDRIVERVKSLITSMDGVGIPANV